MMPGEKGVHASKENSMGEEVKVRRIANYQTSLTEVENMRWEEPWWGPAGDEGNVGRVWSRFWMGVNGVLPL